MKKALFTLFFLLSLQKAVAENGEIPITLEYATTPKDRTWGLMQRESLPKNHGMLFVYPTKEYLSIWMFNCLMDLSIAFLDDEGIIREIHLLRAYPEMMDPKRPVKNLQDMRLYPPNDPILQFFIKNRVQSSFPTQYALEMERDWFKKNQVKVGARVVWDVKTPNAKILK